MANNTEHLETLFEVKDNIEESLKNKGVAIEQPFGLNAVPSYINSIEGGGGCECEPEVVNSRLEILEENINLLLGIGAFLDKQKMDAWIYGQSGKIIFTDQKEPEDTSVVDLSEKYDGSVVGFKVEDTFYISTRKEGVSVKIHTGEDLFYSPTLVPTKELPENHALLAGDYWRDIIRTDTIEELEDEFNELIQPYSIDEWSIETNKKANSLNSINLKSVENLAYSSQELQDITNLEGVNEALSSEYIRQTLEVEVITGDNTLNTLAVTEVLTNGYQYITEIDVDNLNVSNVDSLERMFYQCSELIEIKNIDKFNTSNVKTTRYTFGLCPKLIKPEVEDWCMSNVTDISSMFYGCKEINQIDLSRWNVQRLTLADRLFATSGIVEIDLSAWVAPKLTGLAQCFNNCNSLTSAKLSGMQLTNDFKTVHQLFYGCSVLTDVDVNDINVANVNNASYAFGACPKLKTLNLSKWSFSRGQLTECYNMFSGNTEMVSVDLSTMKIVTTTKAFSMFNNCTSLKQIELPCWQSSNYNGSANSLFSGCSALVTIKMPNLVLNQNSVNAEIGNMFRGCSNLTTIVAPDWSGTAVTSTENVFLDCSTKLKGGTTWSSTKISGAYCKNSGGYFTKPS